jgi:hypothetical protein
MLNSRLALLRGLSAPRVEAPIVVTVRFHGKAHARATGSRHEGRAATDTAEDHEARRRVVSGQYLGCPVNMHSRVCKGQVCILTVNLTAPRDLRFAGKRT